MKKITVFPEKSIKVTTTDEKAMRRNRSRRFLRITGVTLLGITIAMAALAAYVSHSNAAMLREYGIRDPKIELSQNIIAAALKHGLDTANIATPYPTAFSALMKTGIPEALVFDKQGNQIVIHSSKTCNASVFGFIPALDKDKKYEVKKTHAVESFLATLADLHGDKLSYSVLDTSADYFVFLLWSAWAGKLNEDHVKLWADAAGANKKAKLQVIKIDMDLQEWWPAAAKDSMLKKYGTMITKSMAI